MNTSTRLPSTVWLVYLPHGTGEGETVHAICGSDKLAEKARLRLAAELQIPLNKFEVKEVATNAVHLWGILVQDDNFDLEEKQETS